MDSRSRDSQQTLAGQQTAPPCRAAAESTACTLVDDAATARRPLDRWANETGCAVRTEAALGRKSVEQQQERRVDTLFQMCLEPKKLILNSESVADRQWRQTAEANMTLLSRES